MKLSSFELKENKRCTLNIADYVLSTKILDSGIKFLKSMSVNDGKM